MRDPSRIGHLVPDSRCPLRRQSVCTRWSGSPGQSWGEPVARARAEESPAARPPPGPRAPPPPHSRRIRSSLPGTATKARPPTHAAARTAPARPAQQRRLRPPDRPQRSWRSLPECVGRRAYPTAAVSALGGHVPDRVVGVQCRRTGPAPTPGPVTAVRADGDSGDSRPELGGCRTAGRPADASGSLPVRHRGPLRHGHRGDRRRMCEEHGVQRCPPARPCPRRRHSHHGRVRRRLGQPDRAYSQRARARPALRVRVVPPARRRTGLRPLPHSRRHGRVAGIRVVARRSAGHGGDALRPSAATSRYYDRRPWTGSNAPRS